MADLGALSVEMAGEHDQGMKRDVRAPVIRLLTVSQAAIELGLTPVEVDRLVEIGDLHAVNVSPQGGRRFWPADVEACATGQADRTRASARIEAPTAAVVPVDPDAAIENPVVAPAVAARPPHRSRAKVGLAPSHPRWPRYEATTERAASSYLAFRDVEHVTRYLRARQTLDVDPVSSVHADAKRAAELVIA
jgi:hypothetical protein